MRGTPRIPSGAARRWRFGAVLLLAMATAHGGAKAEDVAAFYKGKTIDLLIGFSAGGGYDAYARLVARFMGDHVPGNPKIVPRNMPGAGSRTAAGVVYNTAPRDGTAMATADQSLPLVQALGETAMQFDVGKLVWIGNPGADNNTVVTWHTSKVKTVEDAKLHEETIGASSPTSAQYAHVMNAILGTKFRIIMGYPGTNEQNLAMERGELGGRGSQTWAGWKALRPDWIRDGKLNILAQIGLNKASDLPDTPLLVDLGRTDEDRVALKLLSAPVDMGRPLFVAPGVPPERVAALREAFAATMKDPAFLDAAAKQRLDIDPVSGETLQRLVADILAAPRPVAERLAKILAALENR